MLPCMDSRQREAMWDVLREVEAERHRQHAKWGEQNHPDGTGDERAQDRADAARYACDRATAEGRLTYRHIAEEEFAEALAETDPAKLRAELVQAAAVLVAWIEAIDRRTNATRTHHAPLSRTNGTGPDAGQGEAAFVAPAGSWDANGSPVAGAPPSLELRTVNWQCRTCGSALHTACERATRPIIANREASEPPAPKHRPWFRFTRPEADALEAELARIFTPACPCDLCEAHE